MEGPSPAGSPGGATGVSGASPTGIIFPSRELHLLLSGLRGWYERGAGEGSPQALGLIVGEAGAGKSLLMSALRSALGALKINTYAVSAYPGDPPLGSISGLLRAALDDLAAGRLASSLGETLGSETLEDTLPELRRLYPDLGGPPASPPPSSLGAQLDRARTCDALARAFAAIAGSDPLVLVVENLQWLDAYSRDALAALLRVTASRALHAGAPRLLLVGTMRPGENALDGILDPKLRAFEIDVRGYSREDLRDHAVSLGLDLPLTTREALLRSAEGNPFRVRFCLAGARNASKPALDGLPDDPARFHSWFRRQVESRLGALAPSGRRAVEVLAAFGGPAPEPVMAALIERDTPSGQLESASQLRWLLLELESAGWIRRSEDSAEPLLTGEELASILLERMTEDEQARLHGEIADALLAGGADGSAPHAPWSRIFHHLLSSPGHPRFVEVGLKAVWEAEGLGALPAAAEIYQALRERLRRIPAFPLYREILAKQAGLLEACGSFREALDAYRELAAAPGSSDDREALAGRLRREGGVQGRLGESLLQADCYRQGLALLGAAGESMERRKLLASLGRVLLETGQVAEGQRLLEEALPEPADVSGTHTEAWLEIHQLAEEARYRRRDYAGALALEERIFESASRLGDDLAVLRSADHLGRLHLLAGDHSKARHFLELACERARKAGSRLLAARALARVGQYYRSLAEVKEALKRLVPARDAFSELGADEEAGELHLPIAHLHLLAHEPLAAADSFLRYGRLAPREPLGPGRLIFPPLYSRKEERALAIRTLQEKLAGSQGAPGSSDHVVRCSLAEHLVDAGRHAEASRLYDFSLRTPEAARNPLLHAQILQRAGRLWRLLGDRARSLRYFEKSLELLGPVPDKALVANAYVEVGSIFVVQGEAGRAYDCMLKGLRLFLELSDDQGLTLSVVRLGEFFRVVGLKDLALRFAQAAVALSQRFGLARWQISAHRLSGALAVEAGDFAESSKSFARVRSIVETLELPVEAAKLDLELGWEGYRRGNADSSLDIARRGIEAARQLGIQDILEDFLFLLGTVESALSTKSKNFLRALELLNQAHSGAQARGRPLVEAEILSVIGRIYRERGKIELAREYEKRSRAIVEVRTARLPLPLHELLLAESEVGSESLDLSLAASR